MQIPNAGSRQEIRETRISYFALLATTRVRLSLKRAACRSTTPRVSTGNPGERSGESCGLPSFDCPLSAFGNPGLTKDCKCAIEAGFRGCFRCHVFRSPEDFYAERIVVVDALERLQEAGQVDDTFAG